MSKSPTYDQLAASVSRLEEEATELKQENMELAESVEKFRMQVEHANDAIIILQDENTVYRNPAYEKIIGYSVSETSGRSFLDLVAEEDRPRVREYYYKRLKGEEVPDQYEVYLVSRSGEKVAMEVRPCIVEFQDKPTTMVIMRDITRRKKAEEEREQSIADLRQALTEVKTLRGFLPICAHCSKIRDDEGEWHIMEKYIQARSHARFSHSVCPECIRTHYPDIADKM